MNEGLVGVRVLVTVEFMSASQLDAFSLLVEISEAKMKPRRGNGTPHPKGRRSLVHTPHEEHNNHSRRIQQDEVGEANQNESRSSLQNLIHVHTQVTQTLHQVPLRLCYEGEVKFFLLM